ncbi:MJ0042-type zinc finger domain-containing protein [Teichococcus aestuarii]|uniref:MJ0042-type zinc finger domain-containing protein n=1 Tax=Teichococcus aestuarii TaxID=568898 RepID=UPI00361DB8B8
MRLECPACAAAYDVPDALLAPGRAVRCVRCAQSWVPLPARLEAPPPLLALPPLRPSGPRPPRPAWRARCSPGFSLSWRWRPGSRRCGTGAPTSPPPAAGGAAAGAAARRLRGGRRAAAPAAAPRDCAGTAPGGLWSRWLSPAARRCAARRGRG